MGCFNLRSLLLAAIVISNCITWTASKHSFTHNVSGHRRRHRRNGAGLTLISDYVIPGGEGSEAGWGQWGPFSECSRPCGGGVKNQTRICSTFGPDGMPNCSGGATKYYSCNTQDCADGAGDFRAEQCANYNDKVFKGRTYTWVPYTNGPRPCELNCMPKGERFYYRHAPKVIDGTRCNDESFDVCVNGECQPVGCDMMLGSSAREDKCRECRGNGSNCDTISSIYDNQELTQGYTDILLIPEGATNIVIEEIDKSNNYLALRSFEDNKYYLNGEYQISFPHTLQIAGARWHYERSVQGFAAPDKLRCLGPITEPLYLSLLTQETNVGIKYEYSIRKGLMPQTNAQYTWAQGDFTPCSVTCGTGFRTRNVTCHRREPFEEVEENLCDAALRPLANETCQLAECLPEWVPSPWSPCSKLCGEGSQSRTVQCQKIISNGYPSIVDENQCFIRLGDKPAEHQKCNTNGTCPTWFTGPWKPCDKLCGDGKQTRQVVCHRKTDGRVEVLVDESCEDEKPSSEQPCNIHPCDGIDWVVSNWTGCDSCLSVNYTREALCVTKDRQVVGKEQCSYHRMPALEKPCDDELPPCQSQWYASQWSTCSVDCGVGVKTRKVFCGTYVANHVEVVDDSKCDPEAKYNNTTPCEVPDELCPAKWFTADWSECTEECDGGLQFRKVMCLSGGNASNSCPETSIPDGEQPCNSKPCNIDELISVSSTTVMDDDDLPLCDEEDDEVGAELLTSTSLSDMMVSDAASTTTEGSGSSETEFDLTLSTVTGDFTETGSGESDSTFTTDSTTESETGSGATKETGTTDAGASSTTRLTDITTGSGEITVSGEGSTSASTGSVTGSSVSGETIPTGATGETSSSGAPGETTLSGAPRETSSSGAPGETSPSGTPGETTPSGAPGETTSSSTAGETASSGVSRETTTAETTSSGTPGETASSGAPGETTSSGTIGETTTSGTPLETSPSVTPGETTTAGSSASTDADTSSTSDASPTTPDETTAPSSSTSDSSTGSDSSDTTVTGEITPASSTDTGSTDSDTGSTTTEKSILKDATKAGEAPPSKPPTATSGDSGSSTAVSSRDGTSSTPTGDSSGTTPEGFTYDSSGSTTPKGTDSSTGSTPTGDTSGTTSSGDTTSTPGDVSGSTTPEGSSTSGPTGSTSTEDVTPSSSLSTAEGGSTTSSGSTTDGGSTTGSGSTTDRGSTTDGGSTTNGGSTTDGGSTTEGSTSSNTGASGTTTEAGTGSTSTGSEGTTPTGITSGSETTSESGDGSSTTDDGTTGSDTTTPWDLSSILSTNKPRCRPRNRPAKCTKSMFGCCPDKKTAAGGPFDEGCPTPTTCKDTTYGCCPDGVSPAGGPHNEECPVPKCEETLYGCCKSDNKTVAEGNDQEGCPPPCKASKYGCCADNETQATGPHKAGCPESTTTTTESMESTTDWGSSTETGSTETGSTETGSTETTTEGITETTTVGVCSIINGTEVCQPCSEFEHGCCEDGKTPAHGPNHLGCCLLSPHGCCPDNYQAASGPNPEDCDCKLSLFGCCPDNKSYASGANLTGCGCEHTPHGCCPDRHTEATGPKFKGCSCHTYQFGCCPDGETIAEGPNHQGCLCRDTPYGCCSDGVTPAKGLNQEGCDCASSKYGCCPDGVTTSQSDNFTGCADAPVNRQAACALSYDAGPCMNHSVQWYYDMQYGGCSRFHYGGCEGNGNRFADKAECEDVCVRPAARDACRLPKVKGSCGNSVLRWYYDSQYRGCVQFIYGSCLGNANNFESRELCEKQCAPKLNQEEKCQQAIERGPCAGNFTRWGYDEASGDCQEFLWGGCEGNSNRFTSKAACTLQCNPPGEKKPECQLATDAGNCTEMIPYWSFDGREERCVPIYYSGCGGNKNRFTSQEQCEASCPKSFEKDKCTLPASSGECRNYRERWFYDTKNQQCRMFPYGGCGGNANNFVSEAHCRVECARVTTPPPTLATPPTQPASGETPATCLLPTEPGACSGNELRFTYSTDFLECIPFTYTGCGGNGNNFRDKQSCEDTCRPPKDICELPKEVGPCRAAHRRWYYDTSSRRCEVFYFGGCRGNANNFPSVDECRSECELKRATTTPVPETPKDICTLPPKVGPCRAALPRWHYDAAAGRCERFIYGGCQANGNNFPSVRACEHRCAPPAPVTLAPTPAPVAAECRVSDISQCVGVGRVWYVEPGSGKCRAYDPAPGAARCEDPAVFPSPEACERACGEFKNLGDVCRLNMKEGSCNERQLKYYYDAASRTCLPFTYNGCSGSANRFSSASECENVCMPDPCKMPRAAGNCTESIESWSYDEATDECSSFYYTGCNGNANRYESQDECEGQCKTGVPPPAPSPAPAPATRATAPPQSQMSTDWCRLPVAKGNCNQFILKWYYDEARDSCERFVYTGCNGNDNSFSSKEDCEGLCKMGIEEPPTEPPVIEEQCRLLASLEPCGAAQIAFYYDYKKAACLSAPIGGCTNILNRYRTEEECLRSCGGFRGQDVCHAPLDPGPCRTARQKYYWNLREGRCEPYTYGGCEDPCKMPRAAGNCTESIESWSYDESTDECSSFYYTGCNGNANRYESQDECEGQCKTGVPPPAPSPAPAPATRATAPPQSQMSTDWCRLPVAKGNCNQFILKWYYDETRDSCERFVYTGCNGNDNSFSSKEDCEGLCKMGIEELPTEPPVIEEQCRLLASLEPCGAAQIAFYYDYKKDACLSAPIGGCTNILNRYRTEEECLRSCGDFRGKDVCHAPLDPGPCRTARQKYYWNLHEGRCEPYTYGGCEGGPNRFSNAEECQQICGHLAIDPACGLPPVPGAACAGAAAGGGGGTPRWHHSALYGDCRLFVYYGCGGNGNNFLTKQECERHCSPPPAGNGENEVDCEPARRKCEALRCEFGLTRTKDASGECDRCSCDPNPCADMQCRPGQRCHIVPYRATANGDLKSTSQCRSDCSAERARCESLECEYTVQRTRSPEGCERCECVRPEPNCQPFVDECNALKCNYGPITRTIDGDGCERCTCIAHPCEGKRCSEGQRCVVTASRNATSGEPQYSGDCGTVNKPGSCPVEQTPSGSCHIECNDDADCRGVQKCCHNGCSQLCRAPTPENHPTMSRAPQAPQPDPATEHEVSSSEGGTATLRCLFHSNPPPQITWKRGEITIDGSQGRYKLTSDGALQIVSLYRADSGVYICLAENELGATQQEIVLRVDGPVNVPAGIVEETPADLVGDIGHQLQIRCLAYGYPSPDVRWFHGTDMVPYDSAEYEARGNMLLIRSLRIDKLGEYTCQVFNGLGRAVSRTVVVRANRLVGSWPDSPYWLQRGAPPTPHTERPRPHGSSQSIVQYPLIPKEFTVNVITSIRATQTALATGGRLDLSCDVDGHPEPKVYWTKDNQRLAESDRIYITPARLSITQLAEEDAGEYGCNADNGYTSHRSTVQISVQKLYIPEQCKDNQYFATCTLIVRSNLCRHEYYSKFCCKTCVEAGALNPLELEFQSDQSWTFKKK